ncbi:MAG: BC1872 family protein [Candidatus Thorarchaeota archaeon]
MTPEEIKVAVAENVMGWVVNGDAYVTEAITMTEAWLLIPNFPTDIAAAWLVVKKLVEMGYYVDIGVDKHGAQVQLDRLDNEWELTVESTRARTLPLAICRAALAAVEREEE